MERGRPAGRPPSHVRLLTREGSCVPVVTGRGLPGGSGVRTVLRRGCGYWFGRWSNVSMAPPSDHPPDVVTALSLAHQTEKGGIGRLFEFEALDGPLLCLLSKLALRERTRGQQDRGYGWPAAQARWRGSKRQVGAPVGRKPAGAQYLKQHLIVAARALHSRHSADSRSRPPRPSRHIRDTGPDGVRECRAPLTGVRFPLCYLGWSRLESVALSAGAALSSSESPL